ncbi:MFS transporter [Actinomycetospora sp. NBRC 106378]|jgi:MFS transporter, MHS family, proline/betaine transporter|uniref:MFS transporter n=1 Tax=Actinomycetospora sp. NBRC 106378 TaxID=3032208 RepID=UPI0024A35192|nr:MFS transporter [Actinomycetospora sp. NBRC 106378]GLZ51561.1 MFS transporter [Actinomycetospora sp. NBRC 106378]
MAGTTAARGEQRRVAAACIIGNVLEYFDFALYGFFAVVVGKQFFPEASPSSQLLSSLAVFGVAFLMRPLGGLVFGIIGDRAGRRLSLSISVAVMGVATALIGVLPTYATIGVAAPVLLVLLRCVQGVSVGGEWGASSAYLIETAPPGRRGIRGSFPSMAAAFGLVGGSLLALVLSLLLSTEQLGSWGWRIPFLVAAPLGLFGVWIRRRLEDTPVFQELERRADLPRARVRDAFRRDQARAILVTFCFSWICGVGLYFLGSYVINFLTATVKVPQLTAVLLTGAGLLVYAALCPIAGRLSDRFGRRRTVLFGCLGHTVLGIPMFLLMSTGDPVAIIVALLVFGVIQAPINANTSLILIELFPAATRLTSGSVGFNLGVGAPSGFGPLVAAALVVGTGLTWAPGIFLAAVAAICGLVLVALLPETAGRDLMAEHDATKTAAVVGESRG